MIVKPARSVPLLCVVACLFLAAISPAEVQSFPPWKAAGEGVQFSDRWALCKGVRSLDLLQQPSSDWVGGIIEFPAPVSAYRKPMCDQPTDQNRYEGEERRVVAKRFADLLDEHGTEWFLLSCFLTGLLLGGLGRR